MEAISINFTAQNKTKDPCSQVSLLMMIFFSLGNRDNQGDQVHESDKKFLLVRLMGPIFLQW